MLAMTGRLPLDSKPWAYEFKWDGVRAIVRVERGTATATSRNDKDLTATFPEVEALGEFFGRRDAIVDGELVAFDEDGRPSFGLLQQRLHIGSPAEVARRRSSVPACYLVFDLLFLDGELLTELAYDERRRRLEELDLSGESFATPKAFRGVDGEDVLAGARQAGLEGVVAKRRDSRYRPGSRQGDWLKVKNFRAQEVVIGGWTAGKGNRGGTIGALLLGLPDESDPGRLVYAGKVGTGFDEPGLRALLAKLGPLQSPVSPFTTRIAAADAASATYVRPELVGEVQYGEWTRDGRLRHPTWRGLRPDKNPAEVVREPG